MREEKLPSVTKGKLFNKLLNNFLEFYEGIEAIIVSDEEGLIIAGETRKNIDIEIISFLTAVVNPIIERIRNEFAFKRYGTASFDTDENKLLFISVDGRTTLSFVFEDIVSTEKLYPYAYFLTEKVMQILSTVEVDNIEIVIPNFEFEEELSKQSNRLKYQIYSGILDHDRFYRFKFIIVGDHSVGKTSLIRRFVENRFLDDYRTTIGLNIISHSYNAFGNKINLALWDIGAQRYFKRYRKTYYKGAQAAFIVFDLTSRESFDNVLKWYKELLEFIDDENIPIIIVGNKNDLSNKRVISYEEGSNLANKIYSKSELQNFLDLSDLSDFSDLSGNLTSKISYIETSALTGDHVEEAFNLVSYHFMIKVKETEENSLKEKIVIEINSILKNYGSFTISFITEDPLWSPALQILTDIKELGEYTKVKDKINEKIFQYSNGLLLKNYVSDSLNFSESDAIFCIFDAREKEHIDPKWKETINEITKKFRDNIVILIGIRISEKINWSKLMEEFDINEEMEDMIGSILFFKISQDYKLEIYELIEFMLNFIKQRLLSAEVEEKSAFKSADDIEEELKIKENKIKELSSKLSALKEKIETSGITDEIRARKSIYKHSKEYQMKFKKTKSKIDALKNLVIKYENKAVKDDKLKEAWCNLGRAYTKNREYNKAIEALKRAIEIDSKFVEAWNILGAIYFGKKDYNKAINTFQHLLKLKPKNHVVWYNLGRTYVKNGDYDNAINVLKRAIEIKSDMLNARNVLGATYYVKGNYSKAIKIYQRLLVLKSDDYSVWYNLGRTYIKSSEYDNAIEALEHSIAINPNFASAWNVLGASYFGKGDYTQAANSFKNFVSLDPDDHIAWYNLGEALFAINNYDDALNACNNSLDIDFNFQEALNLRERILTKL
ncbi:MAG: tetratricopeptide repeat protein [Promethearchaeota archaeon]